jgi:hypothetical protein
MSQFLGFRCVVVNGSNLVRAVWEIVIGVVTGGPFIAGETLTFLGGGQAVYLSDTGDGGRLYCYLTGTEVEPAVGNTLTGGTSGATVAVASATAKNFPTFCGNPPRFADSPDQGPIATSHLFYIAGQPRGIIGATIDIKRSSFKLSANWGGDTFNETTVAAYPTGREAAVHRNVTPTLVLPLIAAGEKFSAESFNDAMTKLDVAIGAGGAPPGSWAALTLTSPWVADAGSPVVARRLEPAVDCVRLKGLITPSSDVNTGASILSGADMLPSGYRPAEDSLYEVGGGERIKIAATGAITYEGPGGRPVVHLSGLVFPADGS